MNLFQMLLFVVLFEYSVCEIKKVGDHCETSIGDSGICTYWENCDSHLLSEESNPAICSWNDDDLIVCCPEAAVLHKSSFSKARQKCEEYNDNLSLEVVERIHGGDDVVSVYKYPHMAILGYDLDTGTEWACGGTLISDRFVLTAAHCLNYNNVPISRVQFGLLDKRDRNASGTLQEYKVYKFHSHPERDPREQYHDIALLELENPVKFTSATYPACLHTDDAFKSEEATATGWGKLEYAGFTADILQEVSLKLIKQKECDFNYPANNRLTRGIDHDTQFCAGEEGKDPCKGDSGGPLQINDIYGMPNIIGIISFGSFCGLAPGVYTRVSHYVPWIESIVWP